MIAVRRFCRLVFMGGCVERVEKALAIGGLAGVKLAEARCNWLFLGCFWGSISLNLAALVGIEKGYG
jgi:hypothetical protein